jgi:hypothetical protein
MLVRSWEDVEIGLRVLIPVGAILLTSLVFFATWGYRSIESEVSVGETVRYPLSLAQFAGYVFITALMMLRGSPLHYVLSALCAAIAIVVALKTGSRGQLLAMLGCALVFLPASFGVRGFRWQFVSLVIAGFVALSIGSLAGDLFNADDPMVGRWQETEISEDYGGRLDRSLHLLGLWYSDPLTLVFGLGSSASFSLGIAGNYVHIVPIEILAELGIVGFSIFAYLAFYCVRVGLAAFRSITPGIENLRRNQVIAALLAIGLMEFLLSLKQGTLLRNYYLFFCPILLQAIMLGERFAHAPFRKREDDISIPVRAPS